MAAKRTDIATIKPEQVVDYARKSVTRGRDGSAKSIADQHDCNQETAEYYSLPLTQPNWLTEAKNHGGDEWWQKCPDVGLEWGAVDKQPHRPILTKLIRGVVTGQIKCVIVWSVDRLAREIAIAKILADLFAEHGCLLYDRNGNVPLDSPEARGNFFQTILAAQQYREMCAVNSPRGVNKLRERGKIVVTGNVLGYRHVSKGRIRLVMEEIDLVRRIFTMFVGGMSKAAIARQLMDEGIALAPDLYDIRSIKRIDETGHLIYTKQINTVLKDVRYQGKQPHEDQVWDCPAFLIGGEPAVEPALFERAQELLGDPRRVSNHVSPDNYLAGLFKCGCCGQYLTINPIKQKDGTVKKYWVSKKHDVQTWCTHSLPNITEPAMRSYTEEVLLPLLMAELGTLHETLNGTDVAAEIAVTQNQIDAKIQAFKASLTKQFRAGKLSDLTASILEDDHKEEIAGLETRLQELEKMIRERATVNEGHAITVTLMDRWHAYSDEEKRVAIHSVLKWVILLPSDDFASRPHRKGGAISTDRKKEGAPPAGRVVYLTAWNTLHTATVKRVTNPDSTTWHRMLGLVPAPIEECLGTCADLPNPAGLAAGLERSFKGRGFRYHPSEVMPGYLCPKRIAEFEVD
jgi:DNA invertase Pin-like site-specific DNA recombinase